MKQAICVFAVLILAFTALPASAQFRKVPAEVTEAFKAKYPDTKNVEWKDKLSYFEASYETSGQKYVSHFGTKGEWQQTEKDITQDSLPAGVKDGFAKSKYSDWEVKSVTRIEKSDETMQYRLLVRKSSVEKRYLYFDKDGKLTKDSITL